MAGQGMAPGGVADQVVAVGRLRPTGVRLKDLSALSGPGTAVSVRTIAASRDSSAAVVADADRLHRGGPRPATAACLRRRSTGPLISSSGTRAPFWGDASAVARPGLDSRSELARVPGFIHSSSTACS